MATYAFQAKTLEGKIIKGSLAATSDTEARVKLRSQQLIPILVQVQVEKGAPKNQGTGKVGTKDLQVFSRQFATLINSGIPIVQSLESLKLSTQNPTLRYAITKIKEDIESGKRLADAMSEFPNIFDKLFVNLTRAGEEGGVLDIVLNRLAEYVETRRRINGKIRGALWYPAAVMLIVPIILSVILVFVIPKFEALFKNSKVDLPWLTEMIVGLSHLFIDYWYLIIGGSAVLVYSFFVWKNSKEGREQFDYILLRIPIIGSLIQKSAIARFTRTMSTMLMSGIGIIEALDISAKVSGNTLIEESLLKSKVSVSQGQTVVTPLRQNQYIPNMVVQMMGIGEQSGELDVMLSKIADFYEMEVENTASALTSIIEPIMMVLVGGIVCTIVIAMYLPIFNMAAAF